MKVSVIGAGTMGAGIAQIAATKGHEVCLYDSFDGAIETAEEKLSKILDRLVEKKRITQKENETILGRINFTKNIKGIQGSGLVIEAIIENLEIKQKAFTEIESLVDEEHPTNVYKSKQGLGFFGYIFLIIIIGFSVVGVLRTFENDLLNYFPETEYIFELLDEQLEFLAESVKNIIIIIDDLINYY